MNLRAGIGARAERLAALLPIDDGLIAIEYAQATHGLTAVFQARRAGASFGVAAVTDERRVLLGAMLGPQIVGGLGSYDERRAAFDQLALGTLAVNGRPVGEIGVFEAPMVRPFRTAVRMAPRVIVGSWTEYARLVATIGAHPPEVRLVAPVAALPRPIVHHPAAPIVVWAPHLDPLALILTAFALQDSHADIVVVAASGLEPHPALRARFVGSEAAPDAACCLIDASPNDPAWALALADCGVPLAVASTSGAHEHVRDAAIYDPWNRQSIAAAALRARGRAPGGRRAAPPPPPDPGEAPLVTVFIPTFNRRELLPDALATVARQTYPSIEILVINGGEPVDDLVAPYPNARLINVQPDPGLAAMRAMATREARGAYFCMLDDDDTFFPDHIELLVRAAQRADASIVHVDSINVYYRRADATAPWQIEALDEAHATATELTDILSLPTFLTHAVLYRRDAFEAVGTFVEGLPLAEDYDLWVRLAQRFDMIHVDRYGSLYSKRSDRSNFTVRLGSKYLDGMVAVYERNPIDGRPLVQGRRDAVLATIRAAGGEPPPPDPTPLPAPIGNDPP